MQCDVPLLAAALSSTLAAAFPASAIIDGDMATVCATNADVYNWASVRVAVGTPIAYVAVYNRIDSAEYQALQQYKRKHGKTWQDEARKELSSRR